MSKRILVVGANSQLGKTLKNLNFSGYFLDYKTKEEVDITNAKTIETVFNNNSYDYCFNFAAYTDVNRAETEQEKCHLINVQGVENLAKICQKYDSTLIHISTDFVFDGKKQRPYLESDATNPLNYYGKSKWLGEQAVVKNIEKYIIIRTSWLYSQYNHNFVKTMVKLAQSGQELRIVSNQIGTPTFAVDLVKFIMKIAKTLDKKYDKNLFGLYHFSNRGSASWYDFAKEIFKNLHIDKKIIPIDDTAFPSPAKRPKYSVMSKEKAIKNFDIQIRTWQEALVDSFIQKKELWQ